MIERTVHEIEGDEIRPRWFIAMLFGLVVAGILAAWIGLFAFMGANSAFGIFQRAVDRWVPETDLGSFNLPILSRVSHIYAEDGSLLAELHDGRNSEPVRYSEMPPSLINAVLAAEDGDFFEHEGIDFSAIVSAMRDYVTGVSQRGGSTITQQVVKRNIVGDDLTIQRKIAEALYAIELERVYGKEQILEFYLNSVYFGWSAYGVSAAAREYFGKNVRDLTAAEAATLVVTIRNPSLYDPRRQPERTRERRDDVIDAMAASGFITYEDAAVAKDEPFAIREAASFQSRADHVVAEVRRQLLHDPEFAFLGEDNIQRKQAIFGCPAHDADCEGGGGLEIFVTVDLELQQAANDILSSWLPVPGAGFDDPRGAPTGAIAMIENNTGAVLAMSSGLPFAEEQFDLAVQGRRNPGSAFKPIALAAYLEQGGSLRSYWDARSPIEIECETPCGPDGSRIWTVRNAGRVDPLLSLHQATARSVNAVYAQVAVEVGPEAIADMAHRLGVQSDLEPVYSLALGAGAVSPLEMASAYGTLATNGVHAAPYLISRITTSDGRVIYEREVRTTQAVDPALAAAVRRPMEEVVCCGTAQRAQIEGLPQAGKTGTHQAFRDTWFVGYVPNFTTAVWVGFPDEQIALEDVVINGEGYSRVYGGTVPAPIWKEFMEIVIQRYPAGQFRPVQGSGVYNAPLLTEVPEVEGLTEAETEAALFQARLLSEVRERTALIFPSAAPEEAGGEGAGEEGPPEIEVGRTLFTEPAAGEMIPEGSTVIVHVRAAGPPEAGDSEEEAAPDGTEDAGAEPASEDPSPGEADEVAPATGTADSGTAAGAGEDPTDETDADEEPSDPGETGADEPPDESDTPPDPSEPAEEPPDETDAAEEPPDPGVTAADEPPEESGGADDPPEESGGDAADGDPQIPAEEEPEGQTFDAT